MARPETRLPGPQAKPRTLARRSALDQVQPDKTSHAGLVLDRLLPAFNTPDERAKFLGAATKIGVPDGYHAHLRRWIAHMDTLQASNQARTATATDDGRMIVGLGAESVLEIAITLHRTYGVPFITGSALKGLAARFAARTLADDAWKKHQGPSHVGLFGTHETAGCVVFHDALWVPDGPEDRPPLDPDVMTVHHAKYYQGKPDPATPPADWDDPNPVSFITAQGKYLLAVEGPPAWTDVALAILKLALRREGIGAKTAAGYGRLDLEYMSAAEAEDHVTRRAAEAAAEQAQTAARAKLDHQHRVTILLNNLKVNNASTSLPELFALTDEADRLALAQQCEQHLTPKVVRNAQREDKAWVRPLTAILNASKKAPSQ